VLSQIEIMNEDFQALAGSNGAPGNDAQIEFYLATEDPNGNPTTGITRSTNNTWFNDGGSYWNSLAWDTNRYLNIYTNSASGALGYVPDLPQGGIAGSNSDRVVILYSTFGRNAPYSPFNLGRTVTHELGHYFGLYHTFNGGCSNSYTSGDRIADTNPESSPTYGCPGSRSSCGQAAPIDNYMDYSDDRCMNKFTDEQNNRMRCSLLHYRPNLYSVATFGGCSAADLSEPFGQLNFFDVSLFLNEFASNGDNADINGDGEWNFFDVSDFLTIFGQGCP
jgi:Pregnancy-associated plasma protein-A